MSTINRNHFTELFRVDFKTVAVLFDESANTPRQKLYTYKMSKTTDVEVGDKCLVCVNSYGEPTYKTVTVKSIDQDPQINGAASFDYKWIVGTMKQLTAEYDANVARDRQLMTAVDKLERAVAAVQLKKDVTMALAELDPATANEIRAMFGDSLVLMAPNNA